MKKILAILGCIILLLIVRKAYIDMSNNEIDNVANIENKICSTFVIPNDDNICNPDVIFEIFKRTVEETKCCVIKSNFTEGEKEGDFVVTKYVMLSDDSNYMTTYKLKDGYSIRNADTRDINNVQVMASKKLDNNQVAVLNENMDNVDVVIKTLGQQFSYIKANGAYYVLLADNMTLEEFLNVLKKNILEISYVDVSVDTLRGERINNIVPGVDTFIEDMILIIVVVFYVLLTFYYLLKVKKNVAVMQLMGHKKRVICKELLIEPIISYAICIVLSFIIIGIMKKDVKYALDIVSNTISICIGLILFMLIAFRILFNAKDITAAMKGNVYTTGIYIVNIIAEAICITAVLFCGQSVYDEIIQLNKDKATLSNWEIAKDYGVFYPCKKGYDLTEDDDIQREKTFNTELYRILNEKGAIFVDASEYEKEYIETNGYIYEHKYENSLKVNPNYLNKFIVLDEFGQQVVIDEAYSSLVLLVPEKYKEYEEDILNYYRNAHNGFRGIDSNYYGMTYADGRENVEIRWIKNEQSVFSCNSKVETEGNCIKDCVVQVFTLNNSYIAERYAIKGGGNTDPLKVKLNGDSKKTYNEIKDILISLGVDDNLDNLVSLDEEIKQTMLINKSNLNMAIKTAIVMMVLLIYLIYQSTVLHFDKYKKDYTIKKIYGWKWTEMYGGYTLLKLLIVMLIIIVYAIVVKFNTVQFFVIGLLSLLVSQILTIMICTKLQEYKKIGDVLKGA